MAAETLVADESKTESGEPADNDTANTVNVSDTAVWRLDEPTTALLDEFQDRLDFRRRLQLLPDNRHRLTQVMTRAVNKFVSLHDPAPHFCWKTAASQAHNIQAAKPEGFPGSHDIRRHILHYPKAAAYKGMGTHTTELVYGCATPYESVLVDLREAPQLHHIRQYHVIIDPAVMPDMDIRHQVYLGTDDGPFITNSPMNRHVFPQDGSITHGGWCITSLKFQVLGQPANHRAVKYPAISPQGSALQDLGVSHDLGSLTHNGAAFNDGQGADFYVGSQLGIGINNGGGMNMGGNVYSSRSAIMAIISASAASSPSTRALPAILQVFRRSFSSSTSRMSWSPGTTGRRKRTLSIAVK